MDPLFSKKEILLSGWHKTKEHFWFLFGTFVFILLITAAVSKSEILSVIVGIFSSISIITVAVIVATDDTPSIKDIFAKYSNYKMFLNYIIASVIQGIIVLAGLFLLIVPGIYLSIRLQFYKFLIVDKGDIGPIMALKESWRMTENHTWNLFLFTLLIILLNIVGAMLFGIGLFVTVPVSIVGYALLYRKLLAQVSLAKRI